MHTNTNSFMATQQLSVSDMINEQHHKTIWCLSNRLLRVCASICTHTEFAQIVHTCMGDLRHSVMIVRQVEVGLIWKYYIFFNSALQWQHSHAHCYLRHWWFLDNGSGFNSMWTTSPAQKKMTMNHWHNFTPVTVVQCRLNTVDIFHGQYEQDGGHPVL